MLRDPQVRSGCCDMILGGILLEVLQARQRAGGLLHLVKHDERLAGFDSDARFYRERRDDPGDVEVGIEDLAGSPARKQVHVGNRVEFAASEFPEKPGLPSLPCPLQQKGLAMLSRLPTFEIIHQGTFHNIPRYHNRRAYFVRVYHIYFMKVEVTPSRSCLFRRLARSGISQCRGLRRSACRAMS